MSRLSLWVVQSGDALEIRQRWIRVEAVLLALFAPVPILLILSMAWTGFHTGEPAWMLIPLMAVVSILVLVYVLAAQVVNVSVLRITAETLELSSRPLPWPRAHLILPVSEIGGFAGSEKIHLAYEYAQRHIDYRLHMITGSGTKFPILRSFRKKEQAERIRAMIVDYLKR